MKSSCDILPGSETDPAFLARVDEWVGAAAKARPSANELLEALPGVWPVEVLASIRRLQSAGVVPNGYRSAIKSAWELPRPSRGCGSGLVARQKSLEHPLDFEWLFTRSGQDTMLSALRQVSDGEIGPVLCLGCPTLLQRAREVMPGIPFVLWDKNASSLGQMSEAHALVDIDLRQQALPTHAASAAIVDPPWYNSYFRLFLWIALQNVRLGGAVLVSFPPDGTRPSTSSDLMEIIDWARSAGAELISHRRNRLAYRSPLFEVNALAAAGLPSVALDWRRGDLVVFRKQATVRVDRPVIADLRASWTERRFGSVRWWIRESGDVPAGALRCVWRTPVLPSVSTRFPGRGLANVVTSGNRFLQVAFPARISDFRCDSASDGTRVQVAGTRPVAGESLRLARLIAGEIREADQYFAETDGL